MNHTDKDSNMDSELRKADKSFTRSLKKSIRKEFREKRDSLTPEEVTEKSLKICRRLEKLPEYREANAVTGYMAFRNEVDLKFIMSTAERDGKIVFLPRMEEEKMEFYAVAPGTEEGMVKNTMGISEPDGSTLSLPELLREKKKLKLLVIMPGVAFDRECGRLGYGGGYYDRYIAGLQKNRQSAEKTELSHNENIKEDFKNTIKISISTVAAAYDLQISDIPLPQEETDLRPDRIVTESRCFE